jgi:hypothetical protein
MATLGADSSTPARAAGQNDNGCVRSRQPVTYVPRRAPRHTPYLATMARAQLKVVGQVAADFALAPLRR